jgi:hypothetical protein
MFVVLGGVTVLLGVVTFFWLPDDPSTATFLSEPERAAIMQHVSPSATKTPNIKLDYKQLWVAVKDPQLPLLALMTILVCVSKATISAVVLTLFAAKHLVRRGHLLLGDTDQELRLLTKGHRPSQYPVRRGIDRKHPHRGLRCPPHLPSLAVVHRIMHPWNDWRFIDEFLASNQPARPTHRRLPGQFHRADCDADLPVGGCEHSEPHRASIWRHCYGLLFRRGKHHRASDFPSRGCTEVFAG